MVLSNPRKVAITVFMTDGVVAVQERGGHSKVGEKYGFFGGEIEKGETPEVAIRRELREELGFVPQDLEYWRQFTYVIEEEGSHQGRQIDFHVFLSPLCKQIREARPTEGAGVVELSLERVIDGEGFPKGSTEFLKQLGN